MRIGRYRGFLLLEAVVSFAITCVVISYFYRSLSEGLSIRKNAENRIELRMLAAQLVDQVELELSTLDMWHQSGTDGDLRWTLRVTLGVPWHGEKHLSGRAGLRFIEVSIESLDNTDPAFHWSALRYVGQGR